MPRITFSFSGWVRGANITTVYDIKTGKEIDVSEISADVLTLNLVSGIWSISLADNLLDNDSCEVEIFDYQGE